MFRVFPHTHYPIIMNITNTLHQSTIRHAFLLPGILLGLAAASLPARAATIVPDTWYSTGSAGTPAQGGGVEFVTNVGSGLQSILTYFEPASLSNIGDSLSVSLTFSAQFDTMSNSEYPLSFGFFDSGGTQIAANNLGANGGTPSAFDAYHGYRVAMNTFSRNQSPIRLQARSGTGPALPSGIAYESLGNGGTSGKATLEADTLYNMTYTITRKDANTLDVTFSFTGGNAPAGYNGSWSVASTSNGFTTSFDTFAVMLQSAGTFDTLTFHNVSITTPDAIPEPSTVAVMGMGGLMLMAGLRRWR